MNKIEILENELVKISGPIGKHVLRKQIDSMGQDPNNFPDALLKQLIENSVKNAVYNADIQKKLIKDLTKQLCT
jgi:hypothetical protein